MPARARFPDAMSKNVFWPYVSIVTPSYNQVQFLEQTILSVLNQDYPNMEYIIIDGGSTDGSVDIIRRYKDRLAYWVSEPDQGQAHAINKGWLRSSGEILAWLNSDDYYEPNTVSSAVDLLQGRPGAAAVCGAVRVVDEASRSLRTEPSRPVNVSKMLRFSGMWTIQQPTVFARRWAIEQAGWLDPGVHFLMDVDLFLRVMKRGPFIYSDQVWANFRLWSRSKTGSEGPPPGELEYVISKHWPKGLFRILVWQRDLRNRLGLGQKVRGLIVPGRLWGLRGKREE